MTWLWLLVLQDTETNSEGIRFLLLLYLRRIEACPGQSSVRRTYVDLCLSLWSIRETVDISRVHVFHVYKYSPALVPRDDYKSLIAIATPFHHQAGSVPRGGVS